MKTPVLIGVIAAFVVCLWTLVQFFLGWHGENLELSNKLQFVNWAIWVILGIIAMYATRAGRPPSERFTYGRAVGTGVVGLLAFGLVTSIFTVVYFEIINPDFKNAVLNFQGEQMVKQGMSQQQVDGARGFMEKFFSPPSILLFGLLSPILVGIVPTLLAAIVVRREGTDPAAVS